MQFAPELAAIVGNPVHDIAAAETLRIVKGRKAQAGAGFEIHQFHHHGSGAEIDSYSVEMAAIGVNALAIVENRAFDARH